MPQALPCCLVWLVAGGLAMLVPQPAAATPQAASICLHSSLEASLRQSLPQHGGALAAQVARLLRWRGDIQRQLHPGDRLDLLYEVAPPPQPQRHEPELLAVLYRGRSLSLRAYKFADPTGIGRYYNERGMLIEPQMRRPPVPRYQQITETLQLRRRPGRRKHLGLDLKAPQGAQIVSPFAGRITRRNWHRRQNGLCLQLQFDNGYVGRFLHLARLSPAAVAHGHLAAGQVLGEVGSTGHSGGPHLHYELWRHGVAHEPLDVHGRLTAALPAAMQPAFVRSRDAADRALRGMAGAGAEQP